MKIKESIIQDVEKLTGSRTVAERVFLKASERTKKEDISIFEALEYAIDNKEVWHGYEHLKRQSNLV